MTRRIPVCLVLLLSLWCSTADSQENPRPRGSVRQASASAPRTADAVKPALPRSLKSQEQPLTPKRSGTSAESIPRPAQQPLSLWRVLGSLLIVVAGIFGAAKLARTLGVGPFRPVRPIPPSVCEVLGITNLPHRHSLYLMRMGERLLLVGSAGESLSVLSEITDPREVASITRQLTSEAPLEPAGPSFLSRLLNHSSASHLPAEPASPARDDNARRELEARLNAFAQS